MEKQRICPSCGKEIERQDMCFCPFCGRALPDAASPEPDAAAALRTRYEAYARWVDESLAGRGIGQMLASFVMGSNSFKSSAEHERFLRDVQAMGEEILARCRAGEGREALSALLRYTLIDCHIDAAAETDWMFLATEKVYIPLLEFLTPAEATALLAPYRQLRKRQPGLDFQKTIRKRLQQLAASERA